MEQTTMTKHGPLVQSDRIVALAERNRELAVSGKRRLGSGAMFPGDVDRSFGDLLPIALLTARETRASPAR